MDGMLEYEKGPRGIGFLRNPSHSERCNLKLDRQRGLILWTTTSVCNRIEMP
jgi:hypothetical protein